MSPFVKRRCSGVNAGRKAERLTDPISGVSKNVYFDQRWLCVVQQHDGAPLLLSAWHTEDEAKRHLEAEVRSMERDVERWRCLDRQRSVYRNLSPTPPRGRPDVSYVVQGKVRAK
jgi:hypothetical protein